MSFLTCDDLDKLKVQITRSNGIGNFCWLFIYFLRVFSTITVYISWNALVLTASNTVECIDTESFVHAMDRQFGHALSDIILALTHPSAVAGRTCENS